MKMSRLRSAACFALMMVTYFYCPQTHAATWVNQTRLIVKEKEREVTFSIVNESDSPALIQLWNDRDNVLDRPEIIKMPFVILPPVFRLDGKKSRTVRVQWTQDATGLASDRESLFWLNVLEIPPKARTPGDHNALQMAFRTRIKLFYRPQSIAHATLEEAVSKLSAASGACDSAHCLRLKNPSPLHITLLDITLGDGTSVRALPQDGLIPPFSTLDIPLPSHSGSPRLKGLTWIDDFGVAHHFTQ